MNKLENPNDRRNIRHMVALSQKDSDKLTKLADKAGMSISSYLQKLVRRAR